MFSKGSSDNRNDDLAADEIANGQDHVESRESNLQPIDPSVFSVEHDADENEAAANIDLDAILAANTSQLFAMASGKEQSEDSPADPFEPSAYEEPEDVSLWQGEDAVAVEPDSAAIEESETLPAPDVEPEPVPEPEPSASTSTLEPGTSDESAEGLPSDARSAYSRESATYKHRSGWRSLGTGRKAALIAILVLAILAGIACGVGFALYQNAQEELAIDEDIQESLTPVQADIDPYWMLVLGSDSRDEAADRARSDVIMLVRVDPQAPKVTMVSIPRDTKVTIEGYGTQKINAAYALGGAELAISTVESYSGVKISHYAEIYFSGLEDLVDQLGGVTVDVPEYCKYSDVELQPGVQTLTGHEALIFARCRKTYSEGDFTRTKCQRILMEAMIEKVLAKPVTELPEVVASAAKCFSTDIPLADLVILAQKMQSSGDAVFYSSMAPSTTGMVGGVSYTFTYIDQWKLLMQRASNGEKPTITKKEAKILGDESTMYTDMDMTTSISEEAMAQLQAYWDEKAAKAAKKAQEQAERASESSESETSTSGED